METAATNRMSFEEFERLGTSDQVELLKGELIRMPPAQFRHNRSAERLFLLLTAAVDRLRQSGPGEALGDVHHEMGYLFSGDPRSWLQPDVSLSHPGQPVDRFYTGAPLMAFEFVSESDSARELNAKVAEYLENGAAEVWVIYPDQRRAWVYSRSTRAAVSEDRAIHSELLPGVEIPFDQFL
jgi:Uma2 family endonuclease